MITGDSTNLLASPFVASGPHTSVLLSSGRYVGILEAHEVGEFLREVRTQVSLHYPGTEDAYAARLAQDHLGIAAVSRSPTTSSRCVWVTREETRGPIAYFVATEKRRDSVKLGPIVVKRPWQSAGVGTAMLRWLIEYYTGAGVHKLYMTAPEHSDGVRALAYRCNFDLEGRLRQQYSTNCDELVYGRLLIRRSDGRDPSSSPAGDRNNDSPGALRQAAAADSTTSRLFPLVLVKRGGAGRIMLSDRRMDRAQVLRFGLTAAEGLGCRKTYAFVRSGDNQWFERLISFGFTPEARLAHVDPDHDLLVMASFSSGSPRLR